jgi:hypothetical protein
MKTSPYVLARRKAARGLLRDAQLPGLTDQSRAVLAFNAVCLCTAATLDGMEERMRDELVEIWQYWCFRAKYARTRPWYFRAIAWICRRIEK